jgi:hypothetical protein
MSRQSAGAQYTTDQVWPIFARFLPPGVIDGLLAKVVRRFYRRLFPPLVVLWGFIYQRLQADHTCDAFVSYLTSGAAPHLYDPATARTTMSENTAAYSKARQRLPLAVAQGALRQTAQAVSTTLGPLGLWQGRRTALLDGSTVRLTAVEPLISHYGQPTGQHGASHWPRLRTVGAFDLASGAVLAIEEGPYLTAESSLAVQLLRAAPAGLLWVADQLYGIYHLVQVAVACQQDVVFRVQASHIGRWIPPAKLASGSDIDVVWRPSAVDQVEDDLPAGALAGRLLYVCIAPAGFRPIQIYLFTTLTDRSLYPADAIVQLYARRWGVELNLRHVKTTLAMELLTGKSVDIIRKEWTLGLVAYNLIRGLMGQAALRAGLSPLALSFARCWRRLVATVQRPRKGQTVSADDQAGLTLLDRLATCKLPVRTKRRFEARAVWPKPHQFLYITDSRAAARERALDKLRLES